jgi:uncharacterized membrane protein YedE/YeeE
MTDFDNAAVMERPASLARQRLSANTVATAAAALLVTALAVFLTNAIHWRQGLLFMVGVGAGVTLFHASFGFTSSWRQFIADRRGAGLRAQMLMLGLTSLVFYPALASGSFLGTDVRGSVAPVGLSVAAGAFMFGIGMQLGGGCASGTLFTAGSGNVRMFVTLAAFILGSALGAAHMHLWEQAPALGPVSLLDSFGAVPALAISLLLFGAIAYFTSVLEARRHGSVATARSTGLGWHRFVRGPWPLLWGAVALMLVNCATLALAGRPWGVTSALALWGSKVLASLGLDVASWPYWSSPARAAELQASVFRDATSVMNVGIMLGALGAAGLARRFKPGWRVPGRSLAAAIGGGLLLGYGARIAYGCNIGAYFSGISSASLHGWLWLVAAFAGNALGTRFRPFFGLSAK